MREQLAPENPARKQPESEHEIGVEQIRSEQLDFRSDGLDQFEASSLLSSEVINMLSTQFDWFNDG